MSCSISPAPPPPAAHWRSWFRRLPGWQVTGDAAVRLEVDGRGYALFRMAAAPGAVALLCEPAVDEPLPGYAARRRIRRAIDALHPRHLTLFVDGAHATAVWSWTEREPGGPLAYRERDGSDPGSPPPRFPRAAPGSSPGREVEPPPPDPALARAALGRVLRALGDAGPPGDGDLPQRVQRRIEETDTPDALRAVWRALLGLRVRDPACGRGDWLLSAMILLEPPYLACLERMRVWVDEAARARLRGRRDRLRDFRRLVRRAASTASQRRLARELILLRNLYGADPSARAVAACRGRLLHRLRAVTEGGTAPGGGLLACSLRVGDPARGVATADELARRAAGGGGAADPLREDMEAIARARRVILALHLDAGVAVPELERGLAGLRRRMDRASRRVDALLAEAAGATAGGERKPPETRTLHPLVEHGWVAGGSVVVRGELP